ncbi:MAG: DNA mismatch repair endonuclease MutL [Anaerolineales bacterium]
MASSSMVRPINLDSSKAPLYPCPVPIRVLSDEIASQIAAGEVVERPASVVKELIENSLDSGASQINIRLEGAGQKLIEVSDDGLGIPRAELPLALARHATSKLENTEDLAHIYTLGFRGEALAAIASVSRLSLISRPRNSQAGARVKSDAGKLAPVEESSAPAGTSVRVDELFFNIPARRKFLKAEITEKRSITQLVARYALAYPHVRFSLEFDGKTVLQTTGLGDRREVLAVLYDADLARRMISVDLGNGGIRVLGFIGPGDATRANRSELTFFVNGRWIQDQALSTAVIQAYHGMLMVGRFPIAILFIELPPESVDVNVHPTKAEVRFAERDRVFSAVQRAIRRSLLAHAPVPALQPLSGAVSWRPMSSPPPQEKEIQQDLEIPEETAKEKTQPRQPAIPGSGAPLLRVIGQVGLAYLVAEGPDGLYLVDQHAAHERVLYERFQSRRSETGPQILLEPVTVEMNSAQVETLERQLPVLRDLGFDIEQFGPNSYKVRALPSVLLGIEPAAAIRAAVEDFEEDESPFEKEIESKLIARICKQAAIKAGQTLSAEEQSALLSDLEKCENPRTCPHGRPTMIHLSIDLLERQFGRRGAR